mgnify:CR=1 FL=1
MAKRTGLGRGIGALIPTADQGESRPVDVFFPEAPPAEDLVTVPGARLIHIDPNTIVPNPRQPRTNFDPDELAELVHSVREFGVLQPVVVRDRGDGTYELIMGERRTRASREAGLDSIPAIVRDTADEHLLRDALLENLHRSQLNPLEEASAYQQLLEDFGITQEELAGRIGRSRPQISNTIRLLKLPIPVQQRVAAGVISAGHARAILSVEGDDAMARLADKIVNEDLSVREAEAAAKGAASAGRKPAKPQAGGRRGHLDELAERLGDRLDTRVKITLAAKKGQISIDFASIQDLNRILDELGVERTAYVGYSMGTWIGCGLIAAAPERIVGASFGGFDPLRGAHSCGIPRAVTRSKFGRLLLGVYALWPESRIDIKRCDIPSLQQCFDALYEPMPRITQLRHPHLPLHFWSTHGDFYTPKMKRIAALLEAPIDLFDGHHFTASSDERFVECIFAHVDAAWERTLAAKTPDQRERM